MIKWLMGILGLSNEKDLRAYWQKVSEVNALEEQITALSDEELAQKTPYFKKLLQEEGKNLEDLLPEAFAVVREVAKRTVKMRHFDVQILGGIVLHEGKIAEMKTGEGKTLVATLSAYLNALTGKGVHIVTVNDYLASRDSKWMGPIYEFLGLTVGVILTGQDYSKKKQAYACDITYGTNNEFGFDYLRDNMATHIEECVQRAMHYAIVDEVDSILIDEARTPLIISGQIEGSVNQYPRLYKLAKQLQKDLHYKSEEKQKHVALTEDGIKKAEEILHVESLYDMENMDNAHILIQCLKAKEHFQRDVDYMLKDGEVVIVDEFTGRLMIGRRYSDGLHQAIEAKENVKVRDENQTLASFTFQNYFRMYEKLAGMTGTAKTEESEFLKIYSLEVMEMPTNQTCIRADLADVVYKSKEEKYKAVVKNIMELHKKDIPVLVGTIAIETSEMISATLKRYGIAHNVLNAKYHEKEAEIISQAGQPKAVTIATNMAGRGTDIVLGAGVAANGGLHILGTERHESRRIDNQLRGRAGRQGDPGSTRFFISLEDDLMKLFGSDKIKGIMESLGLPADTPIEHGLITSSIQRAQHKVEQYYFGIRKQVLQYDDVMNRQRNTLYALRRSTLEDKDVPEKLEEMIESTAKNIAEFVLSQQETEDSPEKLLAISLEEITGAADIKIPTSQGAVELQSAIVEYFQASYLRREQEMSPEILREITRLIMLRNIDSKWIDHLYNLDSLRDGIGLRAYGQRDPLVEYKIEGFQMFKDMLDAIAAESLKMIYRAKVVREETPERLQEEFLEPVARNIQYSGGEAIMQKPVHAAEKVGRNDLCPCGSGKKYKRCHGA
ncbi:MAG: preprotein translocase subunit SecA [Candidatus Margulisiibacteriota bacterium]|jgi:preprotein translocase subunit SecA